MSKTNDCGDECCPDVEAIVNHVGIELPDALPQVIEMKARQVARAFARRTDVITDWFVEDTDSCNNEHLIELDGCWVLGKILCVKINGCDYKPNPRKGNKCHAYEYADGVLLLTDYPSESCKDGLEVEYSKYPSVANCGDLTWLVDEHFEAIYAGVMRDMYGMSSEEWADPVESRRFSRDYNEEVSKGIADRMGNNVGAIVNGGGLFDPRRVGYR